MQAEKKQEKQGEKEKPEEKKIAEAKERKAEQIRKKAALARAEQEKKKAQAEKEEKEKISKAKSITRIASADIPGDKKIFSGLTHIKGVSWAFSNAICNALKINKERKISSLTETEINEIEKAIKNPPLPAFLLNRRGDREAGKNKHLIVSDLELQKEFDIRALKKIKTYRGLRHALGLPVRGQRTKAHFRHGGAIGVQKAKVKQVKREEKK